MERVSLFDRKILDDLDLSKGKCNLLDFGISPSSPGEDLCMRPLSSDDYEKGKETLSVVLILRKCFCHELSSLSVQLQFSSLQYINVL